MIRFVGCFLRRWERVVATNLIVGRGESLPMEREREQRVFTSCSLAPSASERGVRTQNSCSAALQRAKSYVEGSTQSIKSPSLFVFVYQNSYFLLKDPGRRKSIALLHNTLFGRLNTTT
jgi:hypothetical protein